VSASEQGATEPPTGTVTLVFTDIQGSTALWERLGDRFAESLDLHDQIMRAGIAAHAGYEVKTEGDAFMIAFRSSTDAIAFCMDAQAKLFDADWAPELLAQPECGDGSEPAWRGVRVRMGAHTGTPTCRPDPVTGRMDYFGPVVNRAARVEAAAHGGQVLVSAAAWACAEPSVKETNKLTELGEHGLKGLSKPEVLRQLLPPRFAARSFPAVRTTGGRQRSNLVRRQNAFVGRGADLERLHAQLGDGKRLVTLLGPGGTGKTSLAVRYGALHLGELPGGVWLCTAEKATTETELAMALAKALDLPLTESDPVSQAGEALRGRGRCLLILDNLEQATEPASQVVPRWLEQAPDCRMVVTSRIPLHVAGEQLLPLEPLAMPSKGATYEEIEAASAVELFVHRAQEVSARFALTPANAADVAAIVRELDGLPLAVELAAARVRILPPKAIRKKLSRRFELLRGKRKDVPDRQATLRGAIDGSWELLSAFERQGLAQCSVFAGAFALDAAESILELDGEDAPWAMDIVEALVDHSLLRRLGDEEEEPRFGLLSSIRAYAAEKLEPAMRAATEERHGAFYAQRGDDQWLADLDGPDERETLGVLRAERADLQVAVDRAIARGDSETAVPTLRAFCAIVAVTGPYSDGLSRLQRALAMPGLEPGERGRLIREEGRLTLSGGAADTAIALLERAQTLAVESGEPALQADALRDLGAARRSRRLLDEADHDLAKARQLHLSQGLATAAAIDLAYRSNVAGDRGDRQAAEEQSALAIRELRQAGARRALGGALGNQGVRLMKQGRQAEARALLHEGLALLEEAGDRRTQVGHRVALALLERREGAIDAAAELLADGLTTARELGERRLEGRVLSTLALVWRDQGRLQDAETGFREAVALHAALGNARGECVARGNLGETVLLAGRADEAIGLLEAAVDQCAAIGFEGARGAFLGALGEALATTGDREAGLTRLDEAAQILDSSGPQAERAKLAERRARVVG